MTKHTYAIEEDGDESENLYWNGIRVQSTNHDDHGWAGMRLARELLISVANIVGAVEVEPPEPVELTETEEDEVDE